VGTGALLDWVRGNPQGYKFDDFWPIIQSTELVHELGAWMIEKACTECKIWENNGQSLFVAVNVSAAQLSRGTFAELVSDILLRTGLDAEKLVLGISEESLYEDEMRGTEREINELKQLGVKLSISGFGNGYSNLSRLTQLEMS